MSEFRKKLKILLILIKKSFLLGARKTKISKNSKNLLNLIKKNLLLGTKKVKEIKIL